MIEFFVSIFSALNNHNCSYCTALDLLQYTCFFVIYLTDIAYLFICIFILYRPLFLVPFLIVMKHQKASWMLAKKLVYCGLLQYLQFLIKKNPSKAQAQRNKLHDQFIFSILRFVMSLALCVLHSPILRASNIYRTNICIILSILIYQKNL